MAPETIVLLGAAASTGLIHTLIAPDHYLPFIVMSKARGGSTRKTLLMEHGHRSGRKHVHDAKGKSVTPWALFVIFVLGPCGPLIPLLMVPAATGGLRNVVAVAGVFNVVTIATMPGVVVIMQRGLTSLRLEKNERFSHAFAGLAMFVSGGAMKLFGLRFEDTQRAPRERRWHSAFSGNRPLTARDGHDAETIRLAE